MATKVELLTNQLNMATERANALHRKACQKEAPADEPYAEQLKQRLEQLERQNAELLAKAAFRAAGADPTRSDASADEIEQCCVVLASVEAQTSRLCKQMERLDNPQKVSSSSRAKLCVFSNFSIISCQSFANYSIFEL